MYEHENAPDEDVPSYFDIRQLYFGYDDDFLYFRYEFESPPYEGTISPMDLDFYGMVVINTSLVLSPKMMAAMQNFKPGDKPDLSVLESERGSIVDLFSNIWLWYWAPLVEIMPPVIPGLGKLPGTALLHIDPNAGGCPIGEGSSLTNMDERALSCLRVETEGFTYDIHDNYLDVTLDRAMLGYPKDDTMNFTLMNVRAVGSDISDIKPIPGDVAYSVSIIMDDRWYIVGQESGEF